MTRAPKVLAALAATLTLLVLGVATAPPAAADPPSPTHDRSQVTGTSPEAGAALAADIVGGDSFLRMRAAPGHEVVVLGYQAEPYLRFGPDGTVEQNRRSPATVLNESRFGTTGDLSGTDPAADPDWERVATDGTYVWHDHRIHWMSDAPPPRLGGADSGLIDEWDVELLVDGSPVVLSGVLERQAAPSPLPWLGAAAVVAALTVALGWRSPRRGVAAVLAGAGLFAAVSCLAAELALPAAVGRRWALVAIPALAAACALGAAAVPRSRYALTLLISAAAVLPLWIGLRWSVLTHAVLPTATGAAWQRLAVAVALGAVLGAAAIGARSMAGSARAASASAGVEPGPLPTA